MKKIILFFLLYINQVFPRISAIYTQHDQDYSIVKTYIDLAEKISIPFNISNYKLTSIIINKVVYSIDESKTVNFKYYKIREEKNCLVIQQIIDTSCSCVIL